MPLDDILCLRTDCVFNRRLERKYYFEKNDPVEPKRPMCGFLGLPELDEKGICIKFIKIIDEDDFRTSLELHNGKYSNKRENEILKKYKKCWKCERFGNGGVGTVGPHVWCKSCKADSDNKR